jgi:hypothetical protein
MQNGYVMNRILISLQSLLSDYAQINPDVQFHIHKSLPAAVRLWRTKEGEISDQKSDSQITNHKSEITNLKSSRLLSSLALRASAHLPGRYLLRQEGLVRLLLDRKAQVLRLMKRYSKEFPREIVI